MWNYNFLSDMMLTIISLYLYSRYSIKATSKNTIFCATVSTTSDTVAINVFIIPLCFFPGFNFYPAIPSSINQASALSYVFLWLLINTRVSWSDNEPDIQSCSSYYVREISKIPFQHQSSYPNGSFERSHLRRRPPANTEFNKHILIRIYRLSVENTFAAATSAVVT